MQSQTPTVEFPAIFLPGTVRPPHLPAPHWRIFVAQKHISGDYAWAEGDQSFAAIFTGHPQAAARLANLATLLDEQVKGFNLQEVLYADEIVPGVNKAAGLRDIADFNSYAGLLRTSANRLWNIANDHFGLDPALVACPQLTKRLRSLWKAADHLCEQANDICLDYDRYVDEDDEAQQGAEQRQRRN